MMSDYCWDIKRDLNNLEHDNQEKENSYHSSYVYEGFISVLFAYEFIWWKCLLVLVCAIVYFLKT